MPEYEEIITSGWVTPREARRMERTSLVWTYMRPTFSCPECGRRGRVQRRLGVKSFVEHRCPGPFTLASIELDQSRLAGYQITIHLQDRPDMRN